MPNAPTFFFLSQDSVRLMQFQDVDDCKSLTMEVVSSACSKQYAQKNSVQEKSNQNPMLAETDVCTKSFITNKDLQKSNKRKLNALG